MIDSPYRIEPGSKIDPSDLATDESGRFKDKADAKPAVKHNLEKLIELQELLYASRKYALLIVLQGMDAAGKDGAIQHVFGGVNPQGCSVNSFKVPSQEELAHDFLWRYHRACPKRGMIGIFNRSHYESVLVERVHEIVPKDVWSKRYDQLNDFEHFLTAEKTIVLKFFLNISKKEQKKRLQSRLQDESKNWKFNLDDIGERKHWNGYMDAWKDILRYCSTEESPWFVVPADHKWFRNWVISDAIVRTLEKLKMKYPPAPKGLNKIKLI